MFGSKGQWKNLYNIKIGNKNKKENLSQNSCLPKLLRGEKAMCDFTNANHISTLEMIDEGISKRLQWLHILARQRELDKENILD